MKKVIIIIAIYLAICGLLTLIIWYNWRKNNLEMYNRDIIPQMKNSLVLKKEIGNIKKIKNGFLAKPKSIGNNQGELKYKVWTETKKYEITVVMTMEGSKYIALEYKIGNKIIKEK